ncbi:MAG: DUF2460 domain-containing protein [Acidobacteriota bacterium]
MAAFPALKTGAVAQYPGERSHRHSTAVYEFVDGREQRFAQFGGALRRWLVRLDQLDDAELFVLEQFFDEQAGASGSFEFTDPWNGTVYSDCSLEDDEAVLMFAGQGAGQTTLVVRENR